MKKKFRLKKVMTIFSSIAIAIGLVFSCGFFELKNSYASSVEHFSSQKKTQDSTLNLTFYSSNLVNLSDLRTQTIYLYGENDIEKCFSFYSDYKADGLLGDITSNNEAGEYDYKSDATLGYGATEKNGQFSSILGLSNELVVAGNNGYLSLSAGVQVKSGKDKPALGNDDYDTITANLYVFSDNEASELVSSEEQSYKGGDFTQTSFSINGESLTGKNLDKIELMIKSKIKGYASLTRNMMSIKYPSVTVSSTDVTKPALSISASSTGWKPSRTISISASDNESGIFKIEYKKDGGDWTAIKDYSTNLEYKSQADETIVLDSNGTYTFRVIDNVGNISDEQVFVESAIDASTPGVEITDFSEVLNSLNVEFNANLSSDGLSPETFTFSVFDGEELVSENELVNGKNTFTLPKISNYKFKFSAYDEAGNSVTFEKTVSVKVELNIQNSYGYDPSGLVLNYTCVNSSISNQDFLLETRFFDETGETELFNVTSRGKYLLKYRVYTELNASGEPAEIFGNGELVIEITKRAVSVNRNLNVARYSGNVLNILNYFDFSEDIETIGLDYEITQNDVPASLLDAKIYDYRFFCTNENYALDEFGEIEVLPYELSVDITKNEFVYNGNIQEIEYLLTDLNGDNLVATVVYKLNGVEVSPICAGTYDVLIDYTNNSNYLLSTTATLVIEKKTAVVSAVDASITYGDALPSLDFVISGLVEADALNPSFVFTPMVSASKLFAQRYVIEFKQASGYSNDEAEIFKNYEFSFINATLTVNPKQIFAEVVGMISKFYGDKNAENFYAKLNPSDIVDGDQIDDINIVLIREEGETVGYYNITIVSQSNSNYNVVLSNSTFQIKKRVAYLSIFDAEKIYGDSNPTFTFASSNILAEDLTKDLIQIEKSSENVGKYVLSYNKSLNDSYVIIDESATFEIKPRQLKIIADEINVVFGETDPLTCRIEGLVNNDNVEVVLSRVFGDSVGSYNIIFESISSENYVLGEFVGAKYNISKRSVVVTIDDLTKTFGETDPEFTFEISNLFGDDVPQVVLKREIGENAGSYEIYVDEFISENYKLSQSNTATLQILKADIIVSKLADKTVVFNGENQFIDAIDCDYELEYIYTLGGVELTPKNAGTYLVKAVFLGDDNHNSYESNTAKFVISKANISLEKLDDQTAVYSGEVIELNRFDTEFNLNYVCLSGGDEVEPILAGTYVVQITFDGDENYNEWISEYNLTITPKYIPVVIKQNKFLFDGKEKSPIFDIELEGVSKGDIYVMFENDEVPTQIGTYSFTIKSRDELKYICNYTGSISIVNQLKEEGDDATISSVSVSMFDASVSIFENRSSHLMNKFSIIRDGRRTVTAYTFNSNKTTSNGEIFTVALPAKSSSDVKIYTIDEAGNMNEVSFSLENGNYILKINDLKIDIIVTESNKIMTYAKIIVTIIVLILSFSISKIIFAIHKKNFFKRTTSVRKFNEEEIKKNCELVSTKMRNESSITSDEFLSIKK